MTILKTFINNPLPFIYVNFENTYFRLELSKRWENICVWRVSTQPNFQSTAKWFG